MSNENFLIQVESRFEAAHHLRSYYGEPEKLHGHSWKVEARVESPNLDGEDISVDYVRVKRALDELVGRFDHNYINEVPPFEKLNPTSENLAKWFYQNLNRPEILGQGKLKEVVIWEGPLNACTYSAIAV